MLMERLAESFKAEAGSTDDVSAALFGREAEQGVRLLQLLDLRYAIVVTNPPYIFSNNMDLPMKRYIEIYYPTTKRDLYATFILRCLELCQLNGRVAMITMQSWMFLHSFSELRALSDTQLIENRWKNIFTGILREASIEAIAHLGPNAFEEISGEIVKSTMFTMRNQVPNDDHQIVTFRLVGLKSPEEKRRLLSASLHINTYSRVKQNDMLLIPGSPIVYWISENIIDMLGASIRLESEKGIAIVRRGLTTGNVQRFIRFHWESSVTDNGIEYNATRSGRWFRYQKGGDIVNGVVYIFIRSIGNMKELEYVVGI